jgi:hypothetical protein
VKPSQARCKIDECLFGQVDERGYAVRRAYSRKEASARAKIDSAPGDDARQHPPAEPPLPKISVRLAEPPSVEGTELSQLALEELDGVELEPPTAARVVTFAA